MAAKSTYASNRALEYLLRTGPVYIGLFTTIPNDDNVGGVEVSTSGTAYARKLVVFNAATNGQCVNTSDLIWNQATANWGAVAGFGLYDAVSGGNQLYADPLPGGSVSISISGSYGDVFMVPAGSVIITEA